jgi:hypothetical protein
MSRGTPGVPRQYLQASQCIDAGDCRIGSQRSIGDRAQGCIAVGALQFLQLCGAPLELDESFFG